MNRKWVFTLPLLFLTTMALHSNAKHQKPTCFAYQTGWIAETIIHFSSGGAELMDLYGREVGLLLRDFYAKFFCKEAALPALSISIGQKTEVSTLLEPPCLELPVCTPICVSGQFGVPPGLSYVPRNICNTSTMQTSPTCPVKPMMCPPKMNCPTIKPPPCTSHCGVVSIDQTYNVGEPPTTVPANTPFTAGDSNTPAGELNFPSGLPAGSDVYIDTMGNYTVTVPLPSGLSVVYSGQTSCGHGGPVTITFSVVTVITPSGTYYNVPCATPGNVASENVVNNPLAGHIGNSTIGEIIFLGALPNGTVIQQNANGTYTITIPAHDGQPAETLTGKLSCGDGKEILECINGTWEVVPCTNGEYYPQDCSQEEMSRRIENLPTHTPNQNTPQAMPTELVPKLPQPAGASPSSPSKGGAYLLPSGI